jgi:hypothetical protein
MGLDGNPQLIERASDTLLEVLMTPNRWRRYVLAAVLAVNVRGMDAQVASSNAAGSGTPDDVILGVLAAQPAISIARARSECVTLPVAPPNDRLQGPHGDTLISSQCFVGSFEDLGTERPAKWAAAHYTWNSVFTAEDTAKPKDARDTATEDEAVLFEVVTPGTARPVWHLRFDSGPYGVWRSVTPEIGATPQGTVLLSVMLCVNGTGGCEQELLHRHASGRWVAVRQTWLDELPRGYRGRIRHGVRIDPRTLRAEAGFYGDEDPNCCPSQTLIADLTVRGDALVLRTPPRVGRAVPR